MNIAIAICDDDKRDIQELYEGLQQFPEWRTHSHKIYTYSSGEQLIAAIKQKTEFDMIFLDVWLQDDKLGTDIGLRLKTSNPKVLLIYISSYDYYREVSQAEPFAFLIKPIKQDELNHLLRRTLKRLLYIKHDFLYSFKFNGVKHIIDLKNVLYFESQHRIINIHCISGTIYQFYDKMDHVEKDIEEKYPYFIRANKSYYVNYKHITNISSTSISLGDLSFKISSKYKDAVSEKLLRIFD